MTKRPGRPATPTVTLHCPSCRAPRNCKAAGTAVIAKQRREAVQCLEPSCELVWIPSRSSVTAPPAEAVPRRSPSLAGARVGTTQNGGR